MKDLLLQKGVRIKFCTCKRMLLSRNEKVITEKTYCEPSDTYTEVIEKTKLVSLQ